ncbi:MAG: protease inhibitor I42 family protein [Endomicrobia bacterium]|nr:protease inhibitor I42 family protein [Endomicrobiia bacterium]
MRKYVFAIASLVFLFSCAANDDADYDAVYKIGLAENVNVELPAANPASGYSWVVTSTMRNVTIMDSSFNYPKGNMTTNMQGKQILTFRATLGARGSEAVTLAYIKTAEGFDAVPLETRKIKFVIMQ